MVMWKKVGPIFCISFCTLYTVSQKNDTDVAYWNFNAHQPIFVIFGRYVKVAFNASIYENKTAFFVSERQRKEWRQSISTPAKRPQNKLITIAMSFGIQRNLCQIYNPHRPIHVSTNDKMLLKFGPVFAEIFGMICRFLPFRPKSYRNSLRNLWG